MPAYIDFLQTEVVEKSTQDIRKARPGVVKAVEHLLAATKAGQVRCDAAEVLGKFGNDPEPLFVADQEPMNEQQRGAFAALRPMDSLSVKNGFEMA